MAKQQLQSSDLNKLIDRTEADAPPGATPKWTFNTEDPNEYPIRIDRDGSWHHQGRPINRKRICKLFSSILRRTDDGRFFLVTPAEQGRIKVEDAPFVAVEILTEGSGHEQTITFRTNLDHLVTVDAKHPIRVAEDHDTGEPSPYVLVRDNLEALILRPQFYQLVDMAEEKKQGGHSIFGVWSAGNFFKLGKVGCH